MDSTKKFSFSFSKVKKLTNLAKPVKVEKEDVQYVDSFDGTKGKFSFLGITRDEEVNKPLVIPLVGTRNAYDVIKAKLDLKNSIVEDATDKVSIKHEAPDENEPKDNKNNETQVETENEDVKPSLEVLAAQEILEEAKKGVSEEKPKDGGLVIVTEAQKPTFEGEKESTLDDYEEVPIGQFGKALLRGMGWEEDVGIGKESQIVAPVATKVRPRRLGLGAEGSTMPNADVPVNKGSYVKVLGGPYKGQFGIVEALDGDCGRAFVKFESVGTVSLSETVLAVVSKKEFDKKETNGDLKKEVKIEAAPEKKYGINLKNIPTIRGETDLKTSEIIFGRGQKRDSISETSPHAKSDYKDKRQSRSPSQSPKRNHKRNKKRDSSLESPPRSKHRSRSKEKTVKKRRSRSRSESPQRKYKSPSRRRRSKEKHVKKRSSSSESDRNPKKRRARSRSKEKKYKEKKSSRRSHSPDKSKKKRKKHHRERSSSSKDSEDSDYRRKKSKKRR